MRDSYRFHRLVFVFLLAILLPLPQTALAAQPADERGACENTELVLVANASTPSGEGSSPPDDVQERAVPRMAPPGMSVPQFEGGVLEGNRLRAKPGYHIERAPGGTAMLRPNSGGNGYQLSCRCAKGTGGCFMEIGSESGSAWCMPDKCTGTCQMRVSTGLTSPGMRMQ